MERCSALSTSMLKSWLASTVQPPAPAHRTKFVPRALAKSTHVGPIWSLSLSRPASHCSASADCACLHVWFSGMQVGFCR